MIVMKSAKFHFREIDWVIYFPSVGNEGRDYMKYGVAYRDRRRGVTQPGVRISLEDVVNKPEITEDYPHTVGYYLESSGKGQNWTPEYLETRAIANLEDFFKFLRNLGI